MIRAGGDLFLTQDAKSFAKEDDATQITLLRQATKNILYSVVNSNAMSIRTDGYLMPVWMIFMIVIEVVITLALVLWGVLVIRRVKREDEQKRVTIL